MEFSVVELYIWSTYTRFTPDPLCPGNVTAVIEMTDRRMYNHYCEANSQCVDDNDNSVSVKGFRCYGNEAMADGNFVVKAKPLCEDGQPPDPCRGCSDASSVLSCPLPTTSNCKSNRLKLKQPFRWCNGVLAP